MDRFWRYGLILVVLLFCSTAHAKQYYLLAVLDYKNALSELTAAQRAKIKARYCPDAATQAECLDSLPEAFKKKIVRYGFPVLANEDHDNCPELHFNYWMVAEQGSKRAYFFWIDVGNKAKGVKDWLDTNAVDYWYGETRVKMLKQLWADRAQPVAQALIRKIIRVPRTIEVEGEMVEKWLTIEDHEAIAGADPVTAAEVVAAFNRGRNEISTVRKIFGHE